MRTRATIGLRRVCFHQSPRARASARAFRSRRASAARRRMVRSTSRSSATTLTSAGGGRRWRTITTRSQSGGQISRVARKASRSTRLARLRVTAPPTFRETVIPNRAPVGAPSLAQSRRTNRGVETRRPRACISRNSERLRTRWAAGNCPCGQGLAPAAGAATSTTLPFSPSPDLDEAVESGPCGLCPPAVTSCRR